MALVIKDRVRETSIDTGTGVFNMLGAVTGYQTFTATIGSGNTTYYTIANQGTNEWEVGVGTVGTNTLTRDVVLDSSNSGSLVNFSSGTKDVFVTYPADKAVSTDLTQTLTNKTITFAGNTLTGVAPLASPALSGTPTAPTAAAATNTTQIATTAHVFAERTATATLTNKTINIANNTLTGVAPLASPALSGTPTAPTAAAATNTTQIATTAHVFAERTNTATLTNKTITFAGNTLTGVAPLNSPAFTGNPTAPTQVAGNNTTRLATTAFTTTAITNERTATATLTNKTLTSPTINTATISGGTINNASVGATTRSTGAFTTLTSNGATTLTAGTASTSTTTGTAVITGGLGVSGRINAANFDGIIGANTAAAGTFTSLSDSGNLTFTGTGNRILGDFSNGTAANRVAFQTSTTNANTGVIFIPNGTGTTTSIELYNNSDLTANPSSFLLSPNATEARLISSRLGTGTFLPMTFYTGGSERMRIDTSGNVGIGTSSPVSLLSIDPKNTSNGISVGDFFNNSAPGVIPNIQSLGSREDGNSTFGGRFGGAYRRLDGTAIASTATLGYYAFGGQWGTDTTYQAAKLLYTASVVGVAEGNFTSATAMPTAIAFRTGATGEAITDVNTTYGTERMRIDSSGNVGIGTSSPADRLNVISGIRSTASSGGSYAVISGNSADGALLQLNRGNNANQNFFLSQFQGSVFIKNLDSGDFVFTTTTSDTERLRITSAGALILAGSTAQKATGTTWSNPSDQRLKDNVRDYTKGINELMQVRVREWEYNGKGGTVEGTKGLGVVADEIMSVLPDTVDTYKTKLNADDEEATEIKKFDATEITWLLVKAIQELNAKVEALEAQLNKE